MNKLTLAAIAIAAGTAAPAHAATIVVNGTHTDASPTFNRPIANGNGVPNTVNGGTFYYQSDAFSVGTSGTYTFALNSLAHDPYFALYQGAFNPASPLANILQADDDDGVDLNSFLSQVLTAGTTYYAVSTTFGSEATGAFTLTIDGPGAITLGGMSNVPEPATWALLILGIGMVGGAMRRRKVTTSVSYA